MSQISISYSPGGPITPYILDYFRTNESTKVSYYSGVVSALRRGCAARNHFSARASPARASRLRLPLDALSALVRPLSRAFVRSLPPRPLPLPAFPRSLEQSAPSPLSIPRTVALSDVRVSDASLGDGPGRAPPSRACSRVRCLTSDGIVPRARGRVSRFPLASSRCAHRVRGRVRHRGERRRGEVFRDDAHLLRERPPAHRPRVYIHGRGRVRAVSAQLWERRLLPHRHRRARAEG